MYKKISYFLLVLVSIVFNSQLAYASDSSKLDIKWTEGPKTVNVGSDLAKLDLPDEYIFANGEDAKKLMKQMDNSVTGMEQGIVFSKDTTQTWFVLFEFNPLGYVRDDDAKKINADKLLADIKKGTEQDNKERKTKGSPTLDIIGWDEKPHYDDKTHNLGWSVLSNSEGEKIVNYNVRILGRGGVTEVTLVAGKEEMKKVKPQLDKIISHYSYKEGKKYTDYTKGDKVSELGLTALIAGGAGAAAVKMGLFGKILLIFKKVWMLIILGIGGLFKKIIGKFKRKTASSTNSNSLISSNMEATNEVAATSSKEENQDTFDKGKNS